MRSCARGTKAVQPKYLAVRVGESQANFFYGKFMKFIKIKKIVDTTKKERYNPKHNKPSEILGNKMNTDLQIRNESKTKEE